MGMDGVLVKVVNSSYKRRHLEVVFLKVHVWLSHICTYSPPYLGFQTLNLHQRCGVEPKNI